MHYYLYPKGINAKVVAIANKVPSKVIKTAWPFVASCNNQSKSLKKSHIFYSLDTVFGHFQGHFSNEQFMLNNMVNFNLLRWYRSFSLYYSGDYYA